MNNIFSDLIFLYNIGFRKESNLIDAKSEKKWKLYICIFICFISILILNYLYPIFADDWVYTYVFNHNPPKKISSITDIIQSQYNHYLTWGGRTVTHFIAQLQLFINPYLQNIINSIAFTGFIFLIYKFSNYNNKINIFIFIFIYASNWFFQPSFISSTLWITGSSNYLWGTLIVLLFIYPYYLYLRNQEYQIKGIYSYIIFFIAGIIAGWTNENMSVATVLMLLFICLFFKKRGILPKWALIGFIGFVIGCILLIAAPGNYVRIEDANKLTHSLGIIEIFKLRIHLMLDHYIYYILPLISIYIVSVIIFMKYKKTDNYRMIIFASVIFIITAHIAFISMIASPQFPTRALFGIISFLIIGICIIIANIELSNTYLKLIKTLAIILLIGVLIYDYYRRYDVLKFAHNLWDKRYEYVIRQKEEGNYNVELKDKIIITHSKFGLYELSNDSTTWYNRAFSTYMGIESIKLMNN